jgi:hypothetical protein|nr:MAG TPA: hypothetical protein [Bacteriophage sp.]
MAKTLLINDMDISVMDLDDFYHKRVRGIGVYEVLDTNHIKSDVTYAIETPFTFTDIAVTEVFTKGIFILDSMAIEEDGVVNSGDLIVTLRHMLHKSHGFEEIGDYTTVGDILQDIMCRESFDEEPYSSSVQYLNFVYQVLTEITDVFSYVDGDSIKGWIHFLKHYTIQYDGEYHLSFIPIKKYKELVQDVGNKSVTLLQYVMSLGYDKIQRNVFVKGSGVYYRFIGNDGYPCRLDFISENKKLPKIYRACLDEVMGKYIKRNRQSIFYSSYINIMDVIEWVTKNCDIDDVDIEYVKQYVDTDSKEDVNDANIKVENILKNQDFKYLYDTLIFLYTKGYKTLDIHEDYLLAVKQKYTQQDVDSHKVPLKTYIDISFLFDVLGVRDKIEYGVYNILEVLNIPVNGSLVYHNNEPYYYHSMTIVHGECVHRVYYNHYNKEVCDIMGYEPVKVDTVLYDSGVTIFKDVVTDDKWKEFLKNKV